MSPKFKVNRLGKLAARRGTAQPIYVLDTGLMQRIPKPVQNGNGTPKTLCKTRQSAAIG